MPHSLSLETETIKRVILHDLIVSSPTGQLEAIPEFGKRCTWLVKVNIDSTWHWVQIAYDNTAKSIEKQLQSKVQNIW